MRYDFERPLKELEDQLERITLYAKSSDINMEAEVAALREKIAQKLREICAGLTSYQRIQLARHLDRPNMMDYLERIAEDFVELHGDRAFRDDHAITAGLGKIDGLPAAFLGHQKGHDTKENLDCNFGMAHPEGFRKARRVMELADRFGLPILTFIDAAGAYPGDQAEERGQALVIAENLQAMAGLKVPIIACVTGEGGSGGALAIGVANRVLVFENAYYAVCTPEACASILLKDGSKAPEMVDNMRILAKDLLQLDLVDEIVPEPLGGAHRDPDAAAASLKAAILRHLKPLLALSPEGLREDRYRRFRRMGAFQELAP